MKLHRPLLILLALLILTACSPAPIAETPVSASIPPTKTSIPATLTPTTIADTPVPTETAIPQLSAQSTSDVIAAMHAYVLMVEEWSKKDISPEESEAILEPLIEFGVQPLGSIFIYYNPHPKLETAWQIADEIHFAFLHISAEELTKENLQTLLNQISPTSEEMITRTISAAEELSIDTTQYGPAFAGAIDAANTLFPEITIQPLPKPPTRGDLNPELIPVQITPFTFDLAGSEIFYTIGTIQNTSDSPQKNVTIDVAYYNFLDEYIGTVSGHLLANVANSASTYPFIATDVIAGEEAALKDQARYEVAVYSTPAEAESFQAFDFSFPSIHETSGEYLLRYFLTPSRDQTFALRNLNIGIAAYDLNDNLVGVGEGKQCFFCSSLLFEATIYPLAGEPVRFEFFAEVVEE